MPVLFEGECVGKAVNPEIGADGSGKPRVRWEMAVTEGEHRGKRASYSGKLDSDNIKFTKRDMMLIGWKGKDVRTFVSDVKAADKSVPFTAEIASNTYQDSGKTSTWTSAKFSGGTKPLAELDARKVEDVNQWFAEAGDIGPVADGGTNGTPQDNSDLPF